MNDLIYWLDLFGISVFAVAGALEAVRKRMDLFGALVVGIVTALGGGTLRDLILDTGPVNWIIHTETIWTAVISAAVTFFYAKNFVIPFKILLYADAIGLAVFTVVGAQLAINQQHEGIIVVMMGVMSGIVGGIIRDVICNDVPLIFRKDVYATAAIAGGFLYWWLDSLVDRNLDGDLITIFAMSVILIIRLFAIQFSLSLPKLLRS